jgi:hypothetical protein
VGGCFDRSENLTLLATDFCEALLNRIDAADVRKEVGGIDRVGCWNRVADEANDAEADASSNLDLHNCRKISI